MKTLGGIKSIRPRPRQAFDLGPVFAQLDGVGFGEIGSMNKSPDSNPSSTLLGWDLSKIPFSSVPNLTSTVICLDKNSNRTSQSCFQTGNGSLTRDHFNAD